MASVLDIILRAVKSGSGFKDTEKDVTTLSKATAGLNKILGAAGLAVGAKEIFDFGVASVNAARESAAANGELEAALTSSGKASAEYKAQLDELATALENTTLFSDEQVQQAEATLVSFRNLGQDVMPQAITVVADMGQKMGDLGAAAQLAGKLLDAPAQAAARAQRAGIAFTQQQTEQIAAMLEVGNMAGAQAVVLDALATKFGGQATAAREAAGGAQDYKVAVDRLQESMGNLLLTIGDAGATDVAVSWIDKLTEGASAWSTVIEQIQLLSEAQAKLTEESGQASGAISIFNAAMEAGGSAIQDHVDLLGSLIGWVVEGSVAQEGFAEAVQEVAAANAQTPASIHPAQRAVQAYTDDIKALAAAQQEALASTVGLQDALAADATNRAGGAVDAALFAATKAANEQRATEEEQAAKQQEQIFKQSNAAMVDAVSELGNQISSAVSGAISGVNQDVIGQLLGIDNAEANAGEAVRRMAAVAAGGIQNEWAPALASQLTGVQDATAQAFVQAFQAGDTGALQGAARQLALNPIVEMFDANLIAAQVEQKLRAQQLTQQLNDKVNALLGEKGLPAVAAISQQVGQAATDTGVATAQVTQGAADMGVSAEAAGSQIQAAFNSALPAIDTLNARLKLMVGLIERVDFLAKQASGSIAGMNPPGAPAGGAGVRPPNGAERRMGGMSPL